MILREAELILLVKPDLIFKRFFISWMKCKNENHTTSFELVGIQFWNKNTHMVIEKVQRRYINKSDDYTQLKVVFSWILSFLCFYGDSSHYFAFLSNFYTTFVGLWNISRRLRLKIIVRGYTERNYFHLRFSFVFALPERITRMRKTA